MAIRLKWKNPNTGATVVRIYRSATPMDVAALPAPIVEVSDGSTSYLDQTPKYGESYYYIFSVILNGREIFTQNKLYSCVIDLGPGPKDITIGDFNMGYFGRMSFSDLGFGASIYPGGNWSFVHKIARKGKILYYVGGPLWTTGALLKSAQVLTSGVTARNDPFAGAGGLIREYGGRLFAPRVAKLWDETNTDTTFTNYNGLTGGPLYPGRAYTPMGKSELIDLARIGRPASFNFPNKFSLNSDTQNSDTSSPYLSCDFADANNLTGYYFTTYNDPGAGPTLPRNYPLTSNALFLPVIEYKGVA
jgi:hypothetical protein